MPSNAAGYEEHQERSATELHAAVVVEELAVLVDEDELDEVEPDEVDDDVLDELDEVEPVVVLDDVEVTHRPHLLGQ